MSWHPMDLLFAERPPLIWELMKRDPAWRWTPYATLGLGAWCGAWHFLWPGGGHFSSILLNTTFAIPLLAGAGAILTQQGDTALEAILPVTIQQVFLARMISVLLLLAASVGAACAVFSVLSDPATSELPLALMSVFTGGLMMVFAAGFSTVRIGRMSLFAIAPLWLFATSMSVFYSPGAPVLACCWLLAIAFVARTWQGLPLSFQSAPVKALACAKGNRIAVTAARPARPWKTVFVTVVRGGGWSILIPLLIMAMGPANAFWFAWLGMQWADIRTRSGWLTALPFPPRTLLAIIVLPNLLTLCGGYELGVHVPWFPLPNMRGAQVRNAQGLPEWGLLNGDIHVRCETPNVLPSLEYWIPTGSGSAPVVTAPWGETFQPPVFRASGYRIYNPWAVGCKNSERFLDWQFARATTALYGQPLVRGKNEGWVERTPKSSVRLQLVHLFVLAATSLLSLLVAMLFDWHRVRRLREGIVGVMVGVAWIGGFGLLFLFMSRGVDVFQWVSWSLAESTTVAMLELALFIAALGWAVDKLFGKVEIIPVRK